MDRDPKEIAIKHLDFFRGEIIHQRNDTKSRDACLRRLNKEMEKTKSELIREVAWGFSIQILSSLCFLLWIIYIDGNLFERQAALSCTICIILSACIWTSNRLHDKMTLLKKTDLNKWPFEEGRLHHKHP